MKEMKKLLILSVVMTLCASAQKIETQKAERNRIVRVETALNHLTVIELGEPVTTVAGGSDAFKVEWRENKVFIQPQEPNVATNLFIWTQSGRLSYELAPAGEVERMHFAIDQAPAEIAKAAAPVASPTPEVSHQTTVPIEMLLRGTPVRLAGAKPVRGQVDVRLTDLYHRDGQLFIRYAVRNTSGAVYDNGVPEVFTLISPRSSRSLYALSHTQLGQDYTSRLTSRGETPVEVVHSEVPTRTVKPGEETIGVVAIRPPVADGPIVLRFSFPADSSGPVSTTLVL